MADIPNSLTKPAISLVGEVNEEMFARLMDGLSNPPSDGDIVVEITTPGGDAELARRMVLEVDFARLRLRQRLIFFGKTEIYSAGVTLMSAFPKQDRYLSSDSTLLIHGRQLEEDIQISGPMRASLPKLRATVAQMELGVRLEEENFSRLIEGSKVDLDTICDKSLYNWYLSAHEAIELGLVEALVDPNG